MIWTTLHSETALEPKLVCQTKFMVLLYLLRPLDKLVRTNRTASVRSVTQFAAVCAGFFPWSLNRHAKCDIKVKKWSKSSFHPNLLKDSQTLQSLTAEFRLLKLKDWKAISFRSHEKSVSIVAHPKNRIPIWGLTLLMLEQKLRRPLIIRQDRGLWSVWWLSPTQV